MEKRGARAVVRAGKVFGGVFVLLWLLSRLPGLALSLRTNLLFSLFFTGVWALFRLLFHLIEAMDGAMEVLEEDEEGENLSPWRRGDRKTREEKRENETEAPRFMGDPGVGGERGRQCDEEEHL